jgi:hypothetical protein
MPEPLPKFTLGTTVLYRPKRPDFCVERYGGKRVILARYSRSRQGGCFIQLRSGGILHVPESAIEPDDSPP